MAPRKPKELKPLFVNHLLEAVKFVAHAQQGKGDEAATHSIIRYGTIIASDRTLAAGARIVEDDLDCCPQTERLMLALKRCGEEHSIVQQPDSLFVRSGEFSAYVPLCDPGKLTVAIPDPACAPLGDEFRAALKATSVLVKENAATVLQSCIQLGAYSACSTNGTVILEAWHPYDMPPGLLIPKRFADAVVKIRKAIKSFGFSADTLTIHFEDASWIRTNLYKEKIPDMLSKLVRIENPATPFPVGFFGQVAEIAKWSEDGRVYVSDSTISSHPPTAERTGSVLSFPIADMAENASYPIASLKLISKLATHFDDRVAEKVTMFFGPRLRGAIAREPIVSTKPQGSGVCYCGQTMDGHSTYDNHAPTEMPEYSQEEANRLSNEDKARRGVPNTCWHGTPDGQQCDKCDDDIPF